MTNKSYIVDAPSLEVFKAKVGGGGPGQPDPVGVITRVGTGCSSRSLPIEVILWFHKDYLYLS